MLPRIMAIKGDNMKKLLFPIIMVCVVNNVYAACSATTKTYTACNAGYYLLAGNCNACPFGGTSVANNTGTIVSCYLPSGTSGSDLTGTYIYTSNCYYSL